MIIVITDYHLQHRMNSIDYHHYKQNSHHYHNCAVTYCDAPIRDFVDYLISPYFNSNMANTDDQSHV